jgi:hypothetical protein
VFATAFLELQIKTIFYLSYEFFYIEYAYRKEDEFLVYFY